MNNACSQHVVVIGASYAGLCAAAAFQANGWRATVVEKSPDVSRTGGGVVVQPRMAEYLEAHNLASPGISSVPAKTRVLYQPDGTVLLLPETARSYTAWDVLLREFETTVGRENIRRGEGLESIDVQEDAAFAVLETGERIQCDLLIGADGVGSRMRQLLLPGAEPVYAGYVAWRGTVDVQDLPSETEARCRGNFWSFTGEETNIVAYEIPGSDGSVEPGQLRVNWVWYLNVDEGPDLDGLLGGRTGEKRRSSLPRGEAPPETVTALHQTAVEMLPEDFATVVSRTPEPFAQAIMDYQAPRLFFDRSVLIGDAASIVRPHLGAGSAKAVDDAVSLADAACGPDYSERRCFRAWQQVRLEDHHALAEQAKAVARRSGLGLTTLGSVSGAGGTRSA
jgi:2-polyprenyl-6-methoxyphenol hydroxylase-like FAD-dependent oxidoreductase